MEHKELDPRHVAVVNEIGRRVPKVLLDKLIIKTKPYSTMKEVLTRALTDSDVSAEDKAKYTDILKSGVLDLEIEETDRRVERSLDAWWDRELAKARRRGDLPKKPINHKKY